MNLLDDMTVRLRAAGCVFAEREAALIAHRFDTAADREAALARRESGEPLEYIVGSADFDTVTIAIGSPVFIPRARAVALLDAADAVFSSSFRSSHSPISAEPRGQVCAVDLGCGAGAIAAAVRRRHPDWNVHACDVDPAALQWARRNAERFGFTVHHGSWFDALPLELKGTIDIVVAHLPYVPTNEVSRLPRDFRDHESRRSVDGGADGLDPLRAVAIQCRPWLGPAGVLLTQVADTQASVAGSIARAAGLAIEPFTGADDDDTVVLALRPTTDTATATHPNTSASTTR